MHADHPAPTTTLPMHLAAAALGATATGVGIFVLGRASETFPQHLALVLVAVAIGAMGIWYAPGERGAIRTWAIGGMATTLVVAMAAGGALSRPMDVNEQVVTADVVAPDGAMAAGDRMMAQDDPAKPAGTAMMARDDPAKRAGDAMMAKDDAAKPTGDAMMAKDDDAKPAGDAMMAKDDAAAPAAEPAAADPAPAQNVLLARGSFEPLEHPGSGTASIIRTADGRTVLTLTDFSTDAGPDLDVRLVASNPATDADVEAGRSVRLAKLKGNSGDQQYVLPEGVDPAEFSHVYIWCRAFSVGFTRAQLA